jgi:hypothetical protein
VRARTTARAAITMAARVADMPRVYVQGSAAVNDCLPVDASLASRYSHVM